MNIFNLFKRAVWIALLPCLAWTGLIAQPMALPEAPPDPLPAMLINTPLEDYGSIDLSGLAPSQWKTFAALHVALLEDDDARARINAMRNVIHFAKQYGDQVDFRGAVEELYAIYRFSRDETERIYAVTALHAIGQEDAMRQLARDVQFEGSKRVRRTVVAAVNDYFRNVDA